MMFAWLIQFFFLFFITISTDLTCWSSDDMPHVYPMPMTEITHIITGWLADSGVQVNQKKTVQGQICITGADSHGSWDISLEQRSALSTAVRAAYSANGKGSGAIPDLYNYLEQYPDSPPTENPLQISEVPKAVMEKIEASVCLRTEGQGESVEFSGFFIDKELILSTAHGLRDCKEIVGITSIGAEFAGEILKLDLERDLALIKIDANHEKTISLETGRNLLEKSEKVYSIGCPVKGQGTVHAGVINGPPRRVGQHPLWQVFMEIQPGRSGSPVFDEQGALVAVIKGRYRGTGATGFLIPLETIMDFLNDYFAQWNTDAIK